MASATPGGAPGYDYDKEFGNNVAHSTAQTSQRLRGYTAQSPEVKGRTPLARFGSVTVFQAFGEWDFYACRHAGRLVAGSPGGAKHTPGLGAAERIPDFAPPIRP